MPQVEMVLSVPAGKSEILIGEHFIYSCPDAYVYEETKWITFRRGDGTMAHIYKIDEIVCIRPLDIQASHGLTPGLQERIAGYLQVATNKGVIEKSDQLYRFYILNEDEVVYLKHRPHTEPRHSGAIYFTRTELTAGHSVVKPAR